MPQPDHISKLGVPDPESLDADLQAIWRKCVDKLGFVPNVFSAYSLKPQRLRHFMAMYNEIMLSESGLSKLEREMIAVVVSSANRCYYCLVAHGAAVRQLSGDPELGEMMALNYRVAKLDARQRAMLDYAWKMTTTPWLIEDADRDALRAAGLSNDGHLRPGGDGGVLQPVQSHGIGDRHDAEPRISSRRADIRQPARPTRIRTQAVGGIRTMLFSCRPEGERIPGRFPGPPHPRGKWFTIDIHCHWTSTQGCGDGGGQRGGVALVSRNRRQCREPGDQPAERRAHAPAGHLGRATHRRHGPDGDRHAGGVAGAAADLLRRRSGTGAGHVAHPERRDRRDRRPLSRPLHRPGHDPAAGARTGDRRTGTAAQIARHARHRDPDPCRGRRSVGRTIPESVRADRGTRAAGVHASGRLHRGAAVPRALLCQRDRQSARYDGGAASFDFRRRAGGLSRPEAGGGAWRRLSAGLCGAHRPRGVGAAGYR